jgi:DNA primase
MELPMTLPSIADLVAQTDLNALVQRYTTAPRTSGNQSLYHCPHPSHPDTNPSFSVTTSRSGKQIGKCFSQCGWQGDALEFIKWIEGVNTSEGVKTLQALLGKPTEATRHKQERSRVKPQDNSKRLQGDEGVKFLASYLRSRGWPQSVVATFGLEVVIDQAGKPRIRHPYLVPTVEGDWVPGYWQDRGSKTCEPKWLSPRGSTPLLFNLRSLEVQNLEAVVICEGAADTITATLALEGCPFVAVVGVPGVNAWQRSWAQLFNGLRVVVAADNDTAGQTLEKLIAQDLDRAPDYYRPTSGDLTDTAKEIGLPALREILLGRLGTQPEAQERSIDNQLELLRQMFPGGFVVGEAS